MVTSHYAPCNNKFLRASSHELSYLTVNDIFESYNNQEKTCNCSKRVFPTIKRYSLLLLVSLTDIQPINPLNTVRHLPIALKGPCQSHLVWKGDLWSLSSIFVLQMTTGSWPPPTPTWAVARSQISYSVRFHIWPFCNLCALDLTKRSFGTVMILILPERVRSTDSTRIPDFVFFYRKLVHCES